MRFKRTTRLIIAVFLVFGMVPFVGALEPGTATITVAASDSTSTAKAQADYVCDGSNDQAEIQNAINALPAGGGTVQLTEGTFNCAGSILPKAHTTLSGQGDDATFIRFTNDGILRVDAEYVTLENFHVAGTGYSASRDFGVVYIRAGHNAVRDVTGTADRTIQALFYVRSVGLGNKNIEDIEFTRVVADSPGTYGFIHSSWGTNYKVHKNVRYTDCKAIDCGRYSAYNPWVTGFDFAELNDIENLRVTRCVAEGTLESGFHFEYGPNKKDVLFTDCISKNNGQKAFPKTYSLGGEDYFGSGYYAPRGAYTFNNCTAEGNSAYGFFFSYPDGVYLYNCTDLETGRGKTDYSQVKPTSFFVVQSQLTNANPSVVMENCTSLNSHGRGLYATLVDYVQIKNFTMTNPGGINGVGALIGDPALGVGFVSSNVDIHASGNRAPKLVMVNSASNSKFTGSIVSDVATPFTVTGGGTKNVVVEGIKTVSNTLPVGSMGITTSSVNSGAVSIVNCAVVRPGSTPPPTPTPTPVPTTPTPSGKPDLVVTDIAWTPANPVTGAPVTLKATVKNQGTAATPAGVTHGILFTFDDGAAGAGVWSDSHTASIAPGAWVTLTANGGSAGATWKAIEGTHMVKATVDDVNRIAESDETNNVRAEQITVSKVAPTPTPTPAPSGKPDLVVTDISWEPANPAPGSAVTLKATVKNQGTAATPAGTKHGILFTFDDGAAGPGVWSDTHTASIAAGASVTLTANGGSAGATWKAALGTHTVKATVDDVNRIVEASETNNILTKSITVVESTPQHGKGDLNGDGKVDWADVALIGDMVIGRVEADPDADFNADGKVDWNDVSLLADYFFGRVDAL